MHRCRLIATSLVALAIAAGSAPGQQGPAFQRMLQLDSMEIGILQTSPDDRWAAFVRRSAETGSLWIVPTKGGAPVRLTSDGFRDEAPFWFPSGDRISFVSNRPNRNGRNDRYGMVLPVDPATGRATGAPRQVTTEPAHRAIGSADGRSILYLTPAPEQILKIIPATGGTARTLARIGGTRGVIMVVPDGRSVYVRNATSDAEGKLTFRLFRVSLSGGEPELLSTTDHMVGPIVSDPRFLVHWRLPRFSGQSAGSAEVTTQTGQRVGEFVIPRGMNVNGWTGSGDGFLGVKDDGASLIRVVSVAGGEARTIATRGFPEAWMPDSRTVIADRPDGEGSDYVLDLVPIDGSRATTVRFPPSTSVRSSGWKTSVGPYFSYESTTKELSAIDVRSGQSRLIAPAKADLPVSGRGGLEQDGDRWVYATRAGNTVEIRSTDPATGESRIVRTFPATQRLRFGIAVHGNRVAYLEEGQDSIRLMTASDANAQARRLASFPNRRDFEILTSAWSWDGAKIAVSYIDRAVKNETMVALLDVGSNGAQPVRRQEIRSRADGACYFLQWLPDGSGLLVNGVVPGRRAPDVLLLPTDGSAPRALTHEPAGVWEGLLVSPDGRQVVYSISQPVNSTVWRVDLRSLLK